MWWILAVVTALVVAAVMFDRSPEVQDVGEKVFGIKAAPLSTSSGSVPKGAITTKMGMKYVLNTEDIFVGPDGERQAPTIALTCTYGAPYLVLDPKTAVNAVEDKRGLKVASLRVSLDNAPAVTAVADIDESGKLYIRGAKSAAKALAPASSVTIYVDTVAGLQSATFDIPAARPALTMLASGCPVSADKAEAAK
jgi:hypothetical protein